MSKSKDTDVDIGYLEIKEQRLYVRVRSWKGKHTLDIRMHYKAEDDTWRPTKKGVSIPVVDEIPEDFFLLVVKAEEYITNNEL